MIESLVNLDDMEKKPILTFVWAIIVNSVAMVAASQIRSIQGIDFGFFAVLFTIIPSVYFITLLIRREEKIEEREFKKGKSSFWEIHGRDIMIDDSTGQMFNFPMVLWYWAPCFLMALLFSMCAVIQDTGLVSLRKLSGQSDFKDTERVGDLLFGLVKGYAGISVIINFYLLLTTPLGQEGSLRMYPILAIILTFHVIIAIDMFRNTGVKWIQKAVKKYYPPQLIEMSFKQSDIDPNELLIR